MGQPISLHLNKTETHNGVISDHLGYDHLRGGFESVGSCCTFHKQYTRVHFAEEGICKWPKIYVNNLFEVLLTLLFTVVMTVLTIPCFVMVLLLGVLIGLTCICEIKCSNCNVFSLTGLCCLGLSSTGMTNRQAALACFAFSYVFLVSFLYTPMYMIFNVLQIPFPYLMLEGLKYHTWFPRKEQTQNSNV